MKFFGFPLWVHILVVCCLFFVIAQLVFHGVPAIARFLETATERELLKVIAFLLVCNLFMGHK